MKICFVFLLLISTCLWAEDEAETEDTENTPAVHEPSAKERAAAELILQGDVRALVGEREDALSLWGQAFEKVSPDLMPSQMALERLTWACSKDGAAGWSPKSPGRDFAQHMRDYFLGSVPAQRQALIRDYCQDANDSEPHEQMKVYANWLRQMLSQDENLELLPMIMEDGLGKDSRVLTGIFTEIDNRKFLSNAPRAFKTMKTLGFLGNADNFTPLRFRDEDNVTFMGFMMKTVRNMDNTPMRASHEALKKMMLEVQPRTIGVDLTLTMMDHDYQKTLGSFLTRHKAELEVMKQDRRNDVLDLFKEKLEGYPNTENMDDAIVTVLRPLLPDGELETHKLEDLLAEALSPEKVVKDENGKFPAASDAAELIINAAHNHPDKAANGLKKALLLLKKCPIQNDPNTLPWQKPADELIYPLLTNPKMFSVSLKAAFDEGLLNDSNWSDWVFSCIWTHFSVSKNDEIVKLNGRQVVDYYFSGDSTFLGEAESFQPILPAKQKDWEGTVLGHLVFFMTENDGLTGPHLKKDVIQILRERKPQTFGLEMIEVMLAKDDKVTINFIHRRAADFSKIPPDRRPAVLSALRVAMKALAKPEKLDPEIRKMLQPLLIPVSAEMDRKLPKVPEARNP